MKLEFSKKKVRPWIFRILSCIFQVHLYLIIASRACYPDRLIWPSQTCKANSHVYPFVTAMVTDNPAACILAVHESSIEDCMYEHHAWEEWKCNHGRQFPGSTARPVKWCYQINHNTVACITTLWQFSGTFAIYFHTFFVRSANGTRICRSINDVKKL